MKQKSEIRGQKSEFMEKFSLKSDIRYPTSDFPLSIFLLAGLFIVTLIFGVLVTRVTVKETFAQTLEQKPEVRGQKSDLKEKYSSESDLRSPTSDIRSGGEVTVEEIYSLALDAYKAGDFKKASMYLEEYLKAKPDPVAYYLLGYSYYKLRDFDKAERAFNEAYLIDPELIPPKIDKKKGLSRQDEGAQ